MRVRVNEPEQILATLDEFGRLEGLPFMPKMVEHCGHEFTVTRWVNNVCFQVPGGADFGNLEDSVLLDVARCDGESFGNCQLGCPLIWKTRWLTPIDSSSDESNQTTDEPEDQVSAASELVQLATLNSKGTGGKVFCQATQLQKISQARPRFDPVSYTHLTLPTIYSV